MYNEQIIFVAGSVSVYQIAKKKGKMQRAFAFCLYVCDTFKASFWGWPYLAKAPLFSCQQSLINQGFLLPKSVTFYGLFGSAVSHGARMNRLSMSSAARGTIALPRACNRHDLSTGCAGANFGSAMFLIKRSLHILVHGKHKRAKVTTQSRFVYSGFLQFFHLQTVTICQPAKAVILAIVGALVIDAIPYQFN